MSKELKAFGQGSTFAELSADRLASVRVSAPLLSVQRAIADYLDTTTSCMDNLVCKKRRMSQLINERWETWIRCRIGSLLCPSMPLKRKWRVIDCKHRTPTYVDEGYAVVSPGDITPGRLDLRRAHRFVDEVDYQDLTAGGRRPKRGDIIYSRNASIGIAAYVDTDEPFCMGQDVCLISSDAMDQVFLMYALNSIGFDQLEALKIGSTFSRVNVAQILELKVPVPNRSEQDALARKLDEAASHRLRACRALQQQIDLLCERRQALITAAVTRELDIPGVAA